MGTPPGLVLEHRASNPVSVKNLTAIETSTIVKLLGPTFQWERRGLEEEEEEEEESRRCSMNRKVADAREVKVSIA
jgi:hypothetical protein